MPPTQTASKKRMSQLAARFKMQSQATGVKDPNDKIKKGIWLYFLLLIFEGALRKWIIPPLANPLLIVRDPVALWLLFMAYNRGLIIFSKHLVWMIALGCLSFVTTMIFGHRSLPVAIYGARILLLHFPLIFVIGAVFTREDVVKIGKFTLLIAGPMALLIAAQFYSPQSALVNRSVGGLESAGFTGALGYFRPPGTFSFTNGTTLFFGFTAPFILYFWLNPKGVNKLILTAATIGLFMAIPFSISRSLFFQVIVIFLFAVIAISRKPENLGKLLIASIVGLVALAVLSQASFFQTATKVFTTRLEGANESEGGVEGVLGDRYLGGLIKSISGSSETPFWGYGLGMGTSVGGMLLSGEQTMLIYAENEWSRLVGEMGGFMGLGVILVRLGLSFKLGMAAYKKLVRGDLLPWMLLGYCLLNLPQGQWGQPTSLGFCIIIGGLSMAALRTPGKKQKVPLHGRRDIKIGKASSAT